MKKSVITSVLAVLTAFSAIVGAQNFPKEYLGLPGDNFNLYAVMDLFRNSPTLEAFERSINDRDSRINNLDLNGDYRVDYIAVSDYRDGRVHNIVLRAVLGRNEYQDVAVIIVEKINKRKVVIQIIGDELLYGRNYIIEPLIAKKHRIRHEYRPVYYYGGATVINNYYYNVWEWPVVVHIYSPYYSGWSSSWYWGYYPVWYEPWNPWYWDYYYGYHAGWYNHYHRYYYHYDIPRYNRYTDYYYHSVRQASPQVQRRVAEGNYRQTYSRPDLREGGMDLQRRTHAAITEGARSVPAPAAEARRQAADRAVSAPVPDEGRRSASAATSSNASRTEAARRATPGSVTRTAAESEAARRSSSATVTRDASATEAGRRTPATVSRTEQDGAGSATNTGSVRRSAATNPESVTVKSEATRATEQRAAETREVDRRAAEARAEQQRAAEAREAQERANEQRAAQARENERRAAEARAEQQRAAQQRAAEARETDRRAAETRTAQTRAPESGSDRMSRR